MVPFALERRSGISANNIQSWVSILLAVYGAALLVGSAIWGWAADKTSSRRGPFLAGLILLIAATGMLCDGSSVAVIVAGRALQGASSAVVWVTGLVIVCDTVGQRHVGEHMGYIALAMSLGVMLAPLLGGIVYDRAGYYAVFGMCFGILGVDVVLRLLMVEVNVAKRWIDVDPEKEDEERVKEETALQDEKDGTRDYASTSSNNTTTMAGMTVDKNSEESKIAAAAVLPPARITLDPIPETDQRRSRLPPIITLLGSPRLLASLWCTLVQATLLTSFDATLPLRVNGIFGWNSLGAGLIFLPLVLPAFSGPYIGKISDNYGAKVPAAAGFVLAIPFLVLLRLVDHNSINQKVLLCALLVFYGLSTTMCLMPLMAEVSLVVEEKAAQKPAGYYGKQGAYAQAYGLFNMAFAGGCMIGPLWAGLVFAHAGWGTMTWSLAILSAFTAAVAFGWVGGYAGKKGTIWQKGGSNAHLKTLEDRQNERDEGGLGQAGEDV